MAWVGPFRGPGRTSPGAALTLAAAVHRTAGPRSPPRDKSIHARLPILETPSQCQPGGVFCVYRTFSRRHASDASSPRQRVICGSEPARESRASGCSRFGLPRVAASDQDSRRRRDSPARQAPTVARHHDRAHCASKPARESRASGCSRFGLPRVAGIRPGLAPSARFACKASSHRGKAS